MCNPLSHFYQCIPPKKFFRIFKLSTMEFLMEKLRGHPELLFQSVQFDYNVFEILSMSIGHIGQELGDSLVVFLLR